MKSAYSAAIVILWMVIMRAGVRSHLVTAPIIEERERSK